MDTGILTQDAFDQLVSEKLREIRTEANLTQDKMAERIGISKKTLVDVEKGRKTLGFTAAALAALLHRRSETVQSLFGDMTIDVIEFVSTRATSQAWYKTLGGRVWWTEESRLGRFIVQKHLFTPYYRIIDDTHYLHYYSLNREETFKRLTELKEGEPCDVSVPVVAP
ncbi:helix-turn-helix domain-containing protein [Heliobacterium gestii]|uniref:Helix-turn-helix domain-containing protein n=1 Tax=Heliomicrobium gestii TaxID=2699 RepID=A0A845LBZ6_HELGE|nr:helix-turn-helix transcriptional regulator [Heliomicrobium gestii]MBM7865929.1 DNA-binding XRE family transcriptional regulator [Heliomicrobium gestii]MZP42169.1 helix-turn-helix domain-containing protein [Heliomicrobium gestii]